MRILLDENIPRKVVAVLRAEGHDVESVHTLRLDGIDNGALYEVAARDFDLCFTRDAEFVARVKRQRQVSRLKLLRVIIPQQRQDEFVIKFMEEFRKTDWSSYRDGDDWPANLE